ncbi:hypothetical protein DT075_31200 [Bacillus licheniformis]|nr:hypothetical protein DT075_31200 [Bacillus licheniformis]
MQKIKRLIVRLIGRKKKEQKKVFECDMKGTGGMKMFNANTKVNFSIGLATHSSITIGETRTLGELGICGENEEVTEEEISWELSRLYEEWADEQIDGGWSFENESD